MFNVFKKRSVSLEFMPQMLRQRGRSFMKKGQCYQKYEDQMTGEEYTKPVPEFMCTDGGMEGLDGEDGLYWVEAEYDPDADKVVISMLNMRLRRQFAKKYPDHMARIGVARLPWVGFPKAFQDQLLDGYPVRFQMTQTEFERLL